MVHEQFGVFEKLIMLIFLKDIFGGYKEIFIFLLVSVFLVFLELVFWFLLAFMLPGEVSGGVKGFLDENVLVLLSKNLPAIFLFVIFIRFCIQAFHNYYMNLISFEFLEKLRLRLDKLVLLANYVCLENIGKARLLSNCITNSSVLVDTMIINALKILSDCFTLIAVVAVMFFVSPMVSLYLLLSFGLVGGGIYILLASPVKRWSTIIVKLTTKLNQLGDYFLFAQREIRVNSLSNEALNAQSNIYKGISQVQTKIRFTQVFPRFVIEFLFFGAIALSLLISKSEGNVDVNINDLALLSFFILCGMRIMPICNQMLICLNGIRAGKGASTQIFNDIEYLGTDNSPPRQHLSVGGDNQLISASGISYKYAGHDNVINDLNLLVSRGDVVLLEGKSGTGKSTAIDLLLGLREASNGTITVAPNITTFFVSQHPFMPEGTTWDYFSLVSPNVCWNKVEKYMEEAGLSAVLTDKQYYLGEGGVNLSGGQKQLFALIASILRGDDLVVFDETTSGLDTESEKRFLQMVKKYLYNSGVIFISHKPAVSAISNKIINFPL